MSAARLLGIEAVVVETEPTDDFDFAKSLLPLTGPKRTGIILLTFPGLATVSTKYAEASQARGLPTLSFLCAATKGGLLMSYGPKQEEYFQLAIALADRILRGDSVSQLPIERPTTFEFVLNRKTARALGLDLPPTLLARAGELIE